MTSGVAVVLLVVGLAGVLRAVGIVTAGGAGRSPLDPWVGMVVGVGLILLGQTLLRSQ